MTISAISSGAAAMYNATNKFESSAARIARAGTGLGDVDIATEAVNLMTAKTEFELATKVIKIASDMEKSAIDILA
jgi:flagellar hook protein FlgE